MEPLIPLLLVLPLIAFWVWMVSDMTQNRRLPATSDPPLTWPPSSKYAWTLTFIFLNVFGAIFYYFYVYRDRRR